MTVATHTPPARFVPPRRFQNAAEWLDALGGVPLERIIFDPWPGTATEADLLVFVERDKRLCKLIDGTLVAKPVGYWEGFIGANVATALNNFVIPRNLGGVSGADSTMRMKSGRVRLPDVGFTSTARLPKTLEPIPTLAPDLAVAVLSETNTTKEIDQKLREYFQSGTRLAWTIDPPTRTAAIYHRPEQPARTIQETESLDGGEVLPGFNMPLTEAFRGVPRS
jgi:Uma2 family endonuclease